MQPYLPAIVVLSIAFSGCLDPSATGAVAEPGPAASSPAGAAAQHSYPAAERDLRITYSAGSTMAPLRLGDMREQMWQLAIPESASQPPARADNLTLTATWTPVSPLASVQHCMVHEGSMERMGAMIADTMGRSPLALKDVSLPASGDTIVVMCMAMNEPLWLEVLQTVHLKGEFSRGGLP